MVNIWSNVVRLLYPCRCALCGQPASTLDLCAACRDDLPFNKTPCARCGIPLPDTASPHCGACLQEPPPYVATLAPYRYEYPLDTLITGLKFHGRLHLAALLGTLLADAWPDRLDLDALVPVPLPDQRLRRRGYNQAREIARCLSQRVGVPVRDICRRPAAAEPLSGLGATERRRRVRGAFVIHQPVGGWRIGLVDDVVTTGATVTELTRRLRRAGAASVQIICVARTP